MDPFWYISVKWSSSSKAKYCTSYVIPAIISTTSVKYNNFSWFSIFLEFFKWSFIQIYHPSSEWHQFDCHALIKRGGFEGPKSPSPRFARYAVFYISFLNSCKVLPQPMIGEPFPPFEQHCWTRAWLRLFKREHNDFQTLWFL